MIKCGDDLEGEPQCILYSEDGEKALYHFPYSECGSQKKAKAAARDRKRQLQFFKRRFRGLLDTLETSFDVSFDNLF